MAMMEREQRQNVFGFFQPIREENIRRARARLQSAESNQSSLWREVQRLQELLEEAEAKVPRVNAQVEEALAELRRLEAE